MQRVVLEKIELEYWKKHLNLNSTATSAYRFSYSSDGARANNFKETSVK